MLNNFKLNRERTRMKIYFTEIAEQDAKDWGGEQFELDNRYFEFVLEANEDGVTLRDTCNRYVPLGFQDIAKLRKALKIYEKGYGNKMLEADEIKEQLNSDFEIYLES